MKKVIVAGHICLDITPEFPDNGKKISDIFLPGKLVEMKGASVSTGGAVANTGLAMKFFGADVRLMGKVGNDEIGDMIVNALKKHDADKYLIHADGEASSYSVVIAVPGVDRIFLHCPGTNNSFSAEDIEDESLEGTALFHFGYPTLMKNMYASDGAELVRLFEKVHSHGVATSLDLAAVDPNSDAGRADWKTILERVIPHTDIFVPSIEELCYMLDRERFEEWQSRAGGGDITEVITVNDIRPIADLCMEMGCKILLLKCGAPGMYYRTASIDVLSSIPSRLGLNIDAWADKEGFEKSYKPDAVLSGTGAGDTSIGAFLTALLEGCSIEECMQLATATGACCVSAYDSLSGLLSFNELRDRIRDGWEKN